MRSDSRVHNALLGCGVPKLLTHTLRCTKTHVSVALVRNTPPTLPPISLCARTSQQRRGCAWKIGDFVV